MALAISSPSLSLFSAAPTIIKPKVCANINGRLIDAFASSKLNGNGMEGYNAKHPIEGLAINSIVRPRGVVKRLAGRASSAATSLQQTENSAENLLGTLLSMVEGTDRGAMLSNEDHERVARIVSELENLCMPEPLKSPFILGGLSSAGQMVSRTYTSNNTCEHNGEGVMQVDGSAFNKQTSICLGAMLQSFKETSQATVRIWAPREQTVTFEP